MEKEIYALKEAKRAEALEQYSKEAVAESEQLQTRVSVMSNDACPGVWCGAGRIVCVVCSVLELR